MRRRTCGRYNPTWRMWGSRVSSFDLALDSRKSEAELKELVRMPEASPPPPELREAQHKSWLEGLFDTPKETQAAAAHMDPEQEEKLKGIARTAELLKSESAELEKTHRAVHKSVHARFEDMLWGLKEGADEGTAEHKVELSWGGQDTEGSDRDAAADAGETARSKPGARAATEEVPQTGDEVGPQSGGEPAESGPSPPPSMLQVTGTDAAVTWNAMKKIITATPSAPMPVNMTGGMAGLSFDEDQLQFGGNEAEDGFMPLDARRRRTLLSVGPPEGSLVIALPDLAPDAAGPGAARRRRLLQDEDGDDAGADDADPDTETATEGRSGARGRSGRVAADDADAQDADEAPRGRKKSRDRARAADDEGEDAGETKGTARRSRARRQPVEDEADEEPLDRVQSKERGGQRRGRAKPRKVAEDDAEETDDAPRSRRKEKGGDEGTVEGDGDEDEGPARRTSRPRKGTRSRGARQGSAAGDEEDTEADAAEEVPVKKRRGGTRRSGRGSTARRRDAADSDEEDPGDGDEGGEGRRASRRKRKGRTAGKGARKGRRRAKGSDGPVTSVGVPVFDAAGTVHAPGFVVDCPLFAEGVPQGHGPGPAGLVQAGQISQDVQHRW
eukprot:jgi/Botrbrau1/21482/Bobra.0695s0001.1